MICPICNGENIKGFKKFICLDCDKELYWDVDTCSLQCECYKDGDDDE